MVEGCAQVATTKQQHITNQVDSTNDKGWGDALENDYQ